MKYRSLVHIVGSLASLLLSCAANAQSKDPVKIGIIYPVKTIIGKQGIQGSQIAVDLINQSGGVIDGRPVQLIVYDSNFSPAEGVAAVQRLLTQDQVRFIAGEASSTVALAVAPVVESEGAVIMFAQPKHPEVTKSGYPGVFRLNTTTEMDFKTFGSFLEKTVAPTRVAILGENSDFGRLNIDNFKRLFGPRLVYSDIFGVSQSDFSALAANTRGSAADLVCIAASGPEQSGNLLKSMAELGYAPKRCITSGSLNNDLPKVAGAAADGVFSQDIYEPNIDNELNHRFVEAYRAKYKDLPGKGEDLGFETVWILAHAIRAAGTDSDPKKVMEVLHAKAWDTPRGEIRFDEMGQAASNLVLQVEVRQGRVVQSAAAK